MKAVFTASLYPLEDGTGFQACVPDVPGCVTTGRDLQDTLDNIRDALGGCLCALEDVNEPLPAPRMPQDFPSEPDATRILIDVDTLQYRIHTDTRAVRKNVSLPSWMNAMADRQGINCSQVLQEALRQRLGM